MDVKITYPPQKKRGLQRRDVLNIARWVFLAAAYVCVSVNISTGGKAWSVIVLWSQWTVWTLLLAPDLVEYNRISQAIKAIADVAILLILIELLITSGWAVRVVPLVSFGGLVIGGALFFTDLSRQKQNIMPLLVLTVLSFLSSIAGLAIWKDFTRWPFIVMGFLALAMLAACFAVLGRGLLREIKKRFHTK